jgi:DNA adenine methylase/adenine-specific DNA-methyltransferase
MKTLPAVQLFLPHQSAELPPEMEHYPRFRYMGSKFKLLPWLYESLRDLEFDTATDAFCGSGAVSYLLKAMGKQVVSNDSLTFPWVLSTATVANSASQLGNEDVEQLLTSRALSADERFIRQTYEGIFYTPEELSFLDDVWSGIRRMESHFKRSLALASLLRSSIKRQPRGLFTVGDPSRYQDGRRDLQLSMREHFIEQIQVYNNAVFDNGKMNTAICGDVFDIKQKSDLVYLDPPYVPISDDNCYMKRYHFLEGIACYWKDKTILMNTKVRKIEKPFTPFAYRHTAIEAFDGLFRHFADSKIILSYSSNAFPDLQTLCDLMHRYKSSVDVLKHPHRYHFGTHSAAKRNSVEEYLIIGS